VEDIDSMEYWWNDTDRLINGVMILTEWSTGGMILIVWSTGGMILTDGVMVE